MTVSTSPPRIDFAALRRIMVDRQIHTFDVTDPALLDLMLEIPRELFVPERVTSIAYSDQALDVGRSATGEARRLLPPMILARLIQAAQVRPGDRALDVAGGGGYGAAVLAGLGASTLALENTDEFCARARAAFAALGVSNARTEMGALAEGPAEGGKFDVILINGAVEESPERLFALLAEGGRLLAVQRAENDPTGNASVAIRWERTRDRFGRLPLFNAAAPLLSDFARPKLFAF